MATAGSGRNEEENSHPDDVTVDRKNIAEAGEDEEARSSCSEATNASASGSEVPPCKEQKEFVKERLHPQLRKGQEWYLLDARWFKKWKNYVAFDVGDTDGAGESSLHPGPIDSSSLYKANSTTLKRTLDELEYKLVPEPVWNKLQAWYGLADGSQPICRRVIEFGRFTKHCKVEVHLWEFKLAKLGDETDGQKTGQKKVTRSFSCSDTISRLTQVMKDMFDIPNEAECRLWRNRYLDLPNRSMKLIENDEDSLLESGLLSGMTIFIEQKGADGVWPRGKNTANHFSSNHPRSSSGYFTVTGSSSTGYSSWSKLEMTSIYDVFGSCTLGGTSGSTVLPFPDWFESGLFESSFSELSKPGLCRVSSLGRDTSFMSSALQCLSNTRELTSYFLERRHIQELNCDNSFDKKGKIAISYGELLAEIWSGRSSIVGPRDFSIAVQQFDPHISGFAHHDSHKLVAFLLRVLHEDLNRIKKKPYVELKDSDGRPDKVVAEEAWENHRKGNESFIVDLFQGQFKSRLVCPECQHDSVTFDPFMTLSLPLSTDKSRQFAMEILLIGLDPNSTPTVYNVTVPKLGCVRDLKRKLGSMSGISPDYLVVADVCNHCFRKLFFDSERLTTVEDRATLYTYVYEVSVTDADDPNMVVLPVYHRKPLDPFFSYPYRIQSRTLFGLPFLLCVPRKTTTYWSLYDALTAHLSRCLKNNANEPQGIDEVKQTLQLTSDGTKQDSIAKSRRSSDLFEISLVNSDGSTSDETIHNYIEPLKLTNQTHVALDWPEEKCAYMDKQHSYHVGDEPLKVFNLYDCLKLFTTEDSEQHCEDDPWYCPKCKKHQQAMKKVDLWKLPEVLVVHLKRFSCDCDKINTCIDFPLTGLDLTKVCLNKDGDKKAVYDLYAISNHFGVSGGGRYTAYTKNVNDGKWYHFDDFSVSPATDRELVSKAAYVLFYTRRKTEPAGSTIAKSDSDKTPRVDGESQSPGECSTAESEEKAAASLDPMD